MRLWLGLGVALALGLLALGAAAQTPAERGMPLVDALRPQCHIERTNALNERGFSVGERREMGRQFDEQLAAAMVDSRALQIEDLSRRQAETVTQLNRYMVCMLDARAAQMRAATAGQFTTVEAAFADFDARCPAERAAAVAAHNGDFIEAGVFRTYGQALKLTEGQLVTLVQTPDAARAATPEGRLQECVWSARVRQAEGGAPRFDDAELSSAGERYFAADIAALQAARRAHP
jgi:hypothetical protein